MLAFQSDTAAVAQGRGATGAAGAAGEVSTAALAAAIAALKGGVDPAGDTLAELYALILLRATIAGTVTYTGDHLFPTQSAGNNTQKASNTAFVKAALDNAIAAILSGASAFTTLHTTGNLGVGTVPAAWGGTLKVAQVGISALTEFGAGTHLASNLYYDGAVWKYQSNGTGVVIALNAGGLQLFTAPSGTAGNTATLTLRFNIAIAGPMQLPAVTSGALYADSAGNITGRALASTGACRLDKTNGTTLTLSRSGGHNLFINGALETVPSGGATLAVSGASGSTLYYVYAFMSGGTLTLERSTTVPAIDTTYGHRIKNGDATRTLVGMAYTDATPNWQLCASHFNRRDVAMSPATFTANRTTTSGTFVELNSEIRVPFLTWGDESVDTKFVGGSVLSSTANTGYIGIAFDGTTTEGGAAINGSNAAVVPTAGAVCKSGLSEGWHYATLNGAVTGGLTLTVVGNATPNLATGLRVMVRN